MSVDWASVAHAWHMEQPHPMEPRLKVGDFATAVKLATKAKFGGHADPHQAAAFWQEFQNMNQGLAAQAKPTISPEEYGQILERTAPVSFAFHGRPPSLAEVVKLREAEPAAIKKHFGELPHPVYPMVSAQDMAAYLMRATPHALNALQRHPVELEAAQFALGAFNDQAIAGYYAALGGGAAVGEQVGAQMRPNLEPPVAGDWGSVRPGVGPSETGITERRGPDRRQPERRQPDVPQPEAGLTE